MQNQKLAPYQVRLKWIKIISPILIIIFSIPIPFTEGEEFWAWIFVVLGTATCAPLAYWLNTRKTAYNGTMYEVRKNLLIETLKNNSRVTYDLNKITKIIHSPKTKHHRSIGDRLHIFFEDSELDFHCIDFYYPEILEAIKAHFDRSKWLPGTHSHAQEQAEKLNEHTDNTHQVKRTGDPSFTTLIFVSFGIASLFSGVMYISSGAIYVGIILFLAAFPMSLMLLYAKTRGGIYGDKDYVLQGEHLIEIINSYEIPYNLNEIEYIIHRPDSPMHHCNGDQLIIFFKNQTYLDMPGINVFYPDIFSAILKKFPENQWKLKDKKKHPEQEKYLSMIK